MHDQRDYDWMLSTPRRQGIEKGREEGTLISAIQALQQVLGDSISEVDTLAAESLAGLQAKLADLQSRVRSRRSS